MRGIQWWVVAAAIVAPLAVAGSPQVMELEANIASMTADEGMSIEMREALFRVNLPGETPVMRLEGARVVVTQYWVNSTVVIDPLSGEVMHRHNYGARDRNIDLSPERIVFLRTTDTPEVRLALASPYGLTVEPARGLRLDAAAPADALGPARAYYATPQAAIAPFDQPPAGSGWVELETERVSVTGDLRILLDGWSVRLENADQAVEIVSGTAHDHHHSVGSGGHMEESYTFLVLRAQAGHLYLPVGTSLEGFIPAPKVSWTGRADFALHHGELTVGPMKVPVAEKQIALDGRFEADLQFPSDAAFAGAPLRASGVGTASVPVPEAAPGAGLAPAEQWGVWSSVAVGALAVGALGVQTYRAPRRAPPAPAPPVAAPPEPEPMGLGDLIERAQKTPLDGELQFRLGVELFRVGRPDVGLRALDRSFRLHPPAIVKLLEDPDLASIRDHRDIRQLLCRFQREQHRKVWAGYA